MADEPKAPEPAKPAAPAPATPAAPATGAPAAGGPPTKLIMMGCGGLAAVVLLIVLLWGLLSLFSCGGLSMPGYSPDLSKAESCAKTYVQFMEDMEVIQMEDRYSRNSAELEQRRALLPWMADKTAEEKRIKESQAWVEAYGKHRSELRKFTVDVIEVKDGAVKLKVAGKQLQKDGENYKLADRTEEKTVFVTQIEGKWKVKR